MPDVTCPVCHSVNPSTRTFCWKCASDLHAVVPDPTAPPPAPKVVVPIQPILIGIGVAVAAIALIAAMVVLLGGTPAATLAPGGSTVPTSSASIDGSAGPSATPTTPPITQAPPTAAPTPTTPPPATPVVTPVPKPKIVSFNGPATVDCSDPSYSGFITLTWQIDNADSTELSIDGSGLYKAYPGDLGTDMVPFSCGNGQHTYTLTTVGGEGRAATRTLTIVENSGT